MPGLPDPAAHRRRVHAQRPCDLPDRPARSHQPHRLDPNRCRIGRPRPAQAAGPAGWAWSVRPRCRRALASARSSLRARARFPCRARLGRPRPGWHRRAQPGRRAAGGGGGRPGRGRGRGRVAGKPRQHRSGRLGLLLRKEAASLTAQHLHLVGEPWRPWSWPSTTAAALAGGGSGLACRWLAARIGVVHARLLAPADGSWSRWRSSTADSTAGAVESVAADPDRVSITLIRAFTRPRAPKPPSVQHQRRSSAEPAPRRRGVARAAPQRPREAQDGSRPNNVAGSGRRTQPGSPCSPEPPGSHSGGGASVRSLADHRSFTRSAAHSSVDHPPLGGTAAAGG
jgi:hypothetical protein